MAPSAQFIWVEVWRRPLPSSNLFVSSASSIDSLLCFTPQALWSIQWGKGSLNKNRPLEKPSTQKRAPAPHPRYRPQPFADLFIASLEHAVQNVLKNYLSPLESTSDARGTFYNKFKREADGYDTDFLKKYGDDLDITLIFVRALHFLIRFGHYVGLTFGE